MITKPVAAHFRILEKIFAKEIYDELPYQSKSKVLLEMERIGLVERMERKYGEGVFAIVYRGWALTHLGRMSYCAHCPKVKDDV